MDWHVKRMVNAINSQSGKLLAKFMSFGSWDSLFIAKVANFIQATNFSQKTRGVVAQNVPTNDPWCQVLTDHINACISLQGHEDPVRAFSFLEAASKKYLSFAEREPWSEPMFDLLLQQLRVVGGRADEVEGGSKNLEACLVVYREFFKVASKQQSKSLLSAIIGSFRVCFKIRKYERASTYVQHVPTDISSHPMSQQVTHNFYAGCISMFNFKIADATEKLSFAYENCSRKFPKTIKLILKFLIPLRLLEGKSIPSRALLYRYSLANYYGAIIDAYTKGDVRTLQDIIQENQLVFIRQGIYLILEKLVMLAFRNLFKKAYKILKSENNVVTMKQFHLAVNINTPMDIDEVECMVANLIFRKYIKGYIAKKGDNSGVKFDKNEPFPALAKIFPLQTL